MTEIHLVPLTDIQCTNRIRKDYGDLEALATSIATLGLLHPIVLDSQRRLIVGERRMKAYQQLGHTAIPAIIATTFDDIEKALYAERDENVERKDWVPSEAVAMAAKLEPYERQDAQRRLVASHHTAGKVSGQVRTGNGGKTFPTVPKRDEKARSKSRTAHAVGMSRPTLEKAQAVVQAAAKDPERFGPVQERMDKTGKVDGAYRKVSKAKKVDQLRARETAPAPLNALYDVLVIDPPWPVAVQAREERPNQLGLDYVPMTLAQIRALTLPLAESCHVWLWTTHRFLPEALACLHAWNLTYVCCFVWHKPGGMQPMDLPQFNCEFALYARYGHPVFLDTTAFHTCFDAPRAAHSAKPESFYTVIRRVTAGKRLDMFNRRPIEGFDGWGYETCDQTKEAL